MRVTGKVRFSFVHVFEPKSVEGGDPKYSVTLLIPKTDSNTWEKIKAAVTAATEHYRSRNGQNSLPAKPTTIIHDGDGIRPNGDAFGPECKGCYVMTVSSKTKPVIVDSFRNPITDPTEFYSGCYGRAAINFYGYNSHGKKGISAGLLSVQKLCDGEPFGTVGSADDFDDDYKDDDIEEVGGDDFMS